MNLPSWWRVLRGRRATCMRACPAPGRLSLSSGACEIKSIILIGGIVRVYAARAK
ncbi:hypothetical protein X907_2605 [Glycocaulis alkaliphilus]|uniref:Uncharacterized protein n=1 Tax=Glycocaulis alkaliphilus TaxID=1434191 RepID=A0A3T0ECT9_9PROT|nr:hypothetical protein X907_2605 [Glycocaulis alkaliphilus]